MRQAWIMAILGMLTYMPAAAQRPSREEQRRTLDGARQIALHYSGTLPDFVCTEMVQRANALAGARSTTNDRLTMQLSYFGQQEKYKIVALNGHLTEQSLESLGGLITGGEFGSLLLRVFESSSPADFEWKNWSSIRKRRMSVYAYNVVRARSHYVLGYRTDEGTRVAAIVGYRGEVVVDSELPRVLRITARAEDIPKESAILHSSIEVDYGLIDVAGRSYLLPVRAEAEMTRPDREMRNVATFVGYRKFDAESTINFRVPGR